LQAPATIFTERDILSLRSGPFFLPSSILISIMWAMREIAEYIQPVTGRGIGYKLFAADLFPDMSWNSMQSVYRLLRLAREEGVVPWHWIVDETRTLEKCSSWAHAEVDRAGEG